MKPRWSDEHKRASTRGDGYSYRHLENEFGQHGKGCLEESFFWLCSAAPLETGERTSGGDDCDG
jgi:hypothetical protein